MPFCNDLKIFFPGYLMNYSKGMVSIKEKSPSAKVNEIVWVNSDFQCIDSCIVKDLSSFFQKAQSTDIFKLDCDGIMLFEENGQKYMFFTELKSTFDTSDVYYAKDQIISSYIKINMIMHLLIGYNSADFIVKGFVVCLPPDKNFLRDLYRKQQLSLSSKFKTEADFTLELCYERNRKSVMKPLDCDKLKKLPLGNNGIFKTIEFHYIEVANGSSSITIDVKKYI